MSLVLLCFSFIQCSKGDNAITPIMPSGYQEIVNEPTDSEMFEALRTTQEDTHFLNPQMAPIMSERTFNDIEKSIEAIIGNEDFPEDQLMYLFAEPESGAVFNPPVVCFAFAAKPGTINPADIDVSLDGQDISNVIHYNYYYDPGRKANYYLAHYKPENYLNPENQHNLDVDFNPPLGERLNRNFSFSVPQDENLKIVKAGFLYNKAEKKPVHNKLIVSIQIPKDVKIGNRLLNSQGWILNYENRQPLPDIHSIEQRNQGSYIITFTKDVAPKSSVFLKINPADGIYSPEFELLSPPDYVNRGGSADRKAMTSCCEGHFNFVTPHSAELCESNHIVVASVDCPDFPCTGEIVITGTEIVYTYAHNYVDDQSEIGHPNPLPYTESTGCSGAYTNSFPAKVDYHLTYELTGEDETGTSCGILDTEEPIDLLSDQTFPTNLTATVSEETICSHPPPCFPCEESKRYMLTVTAYDEHCINNEPNFYWIYESQCDPNFGAIILYPDHRHVPDPPVDDQHLDKKYFIKQDILACVEYIKVIVLDQKGNWNSTRVVKGIHPVYDSLPYPTDVTLSFDDQDREGNEQYVNLDRDIDWSADCLPDQNVCVFTLDRPDHGNRIFMEIIVDPPIEGITVTIEFEDPEFNEGTNTGPTNKKAGGNSKYTPTNNPDLLSGTVPEENEEDLLWGSHPPWAGDNLELGDNYNYYHECDNCNLNGLNTYIDIVWPGVVPLNDPLRGHLPDGIPYFTDNPGFFPAGCFGTDTLKVTPRINITTNIYGRAATYFDTRGHGGDNFAFKAYVERQHCPNKCLVESIPNGKIFTVKRRMFLEYAFMEDRGDTYPEGCNYGTDKEFPERHTIPDESFDWIIGAFDDGFIEVVKADDPFCSDLPYELSLDHNVGEPWNYELVIYGDQSNFRPNPPLDTILLIGMDHFKAPCYNTSSESYAGGSAVPHWIFLYPSDAIYTYVGVGVTYDAFNNGKAHISKEDEKGARYAKIIGNTATHEIFHSWNLTFDPIPIIPCDVPYGVMNYDDRRSYFHCDHIIDIRKGTSKFDQRDY